LWTFWGRRAAAAVVFFQTLGLTGGRGADVSFAPGEEAPYVYQAETLSGRYTGAMEKLAIAFARAGTNLECRAEITGADIAESAVARVTQDGYLIAAQQRSRRHGNETSAKVTTVEDGVLMSRTENGKETVKRAAPSPGQPVLCDLSILGYFRVAAPATGTTARVLMADYTQRTAPASVRNRGDETVTVPAGTFVCHKIEVTVETVFYRKRFSYWITQEPPHFVVKHIGIRGASTPEYSTVLLKLPEPRKAETH